MENRDNNKTYCVYLHTNRMNMKRYVGITSQKPEKRWNGGEGYQTQKKFYNAIRLYGWNNFDHEILEEGLTKEEAYEREQYWVSYFNSFKNGYNATPGGRTPCEYWRKNAPLEKYQRVGRAVRVVETGDIYISIAQAAKVYCVNKTTIVDAIDHNRELQGFHFEYLDAAGLKNTISKIREEKMIREWEAADREENLKYKQQEEEEW